MSQSAYRVGVMLPKTFRDCAQPFRERRIDHRYVLGGDFLCAVVVPNALVTVQLLAAHDVHLVDLSFPFRRRLRLVGVPEVQVPPRCARSRCRCRGPIRR